jgi:hypothetical protein
MLLETVKLLANDDLAMIPIRLYLQGVSYLQNCNYDGAVDLCYEFFTQAFVLYEEEISDSKEQVWALQLLSGTLLEMECFKEEEHGSLRSQLALASARLLRKADQTRAILSVCHVMWSSKVKENDGSINILKDEKKVVNFIGKAIKTTDKCLESELKVQLYVEILEKIYNFKCDGFSLELLQSHQETVTKKIEAEKINNPSIEQHWKKIKILLSGEKVPQEISEPEVNEPEEQQPEVEPVAPMAELEVESEATPDTKSEVQPEIEPEVQPKVQQEVQPEVQPEVQQEVQPEVNSEVTEAPASSNEQPADEATKDATDQPAEQLDQPAASGDASTEN